MRCYEDKGIQTNKAKFIGSQFSPREERAKWTAEEDSSLISLAITHNARNWNIIAASMNERFPIGKKTSKQCRERWHNCLDLGINHKSWSKWEEAMLIKAHMDYRNRWCDIALRFKGRHNNMIKNRFYSILRKIKNKIRNNDFNAQDQLELLEMYYMTSLMISYIRNPRPIEDHRRKRGKDFMHTLVNDLSVITLDSYRCDLESCYPLKESLEIELQKIIEVEENKSKDTPNTNSIYSKLLPDVQTSSSELLITVEQILEFCIGSKNKALILPVPQSYSCKEPFTLDEKQSVIEEVFHRKIPTTFL